MVERLAGEMRLLVPDAALETGAKLVGKTPADDYRRLWSVSRALDPLLGVRGVTPSDVHAQSVWVVGLARFLRMTQNLLGDVKKPKRPLGKHPNHAIAAAYKLLERIAGAQKNLWMEPVQVPKPPRPVETPAEVYDALQIVIAEMQSIKHRLGVQRHISEPAPEKGKTPDDVILGGEGFSSTDVYRKTQEVIAEIELISRHLNRYKDHRLPPLAAGKTSDDVIANAIAVLEHIERIQRCAGIYAKQPPVPRQGEEVTPSDVYNLLSVVQAELITLKGRLGVAKEPEPIEKAPGNKTPGHVLQMLDFAHILLTDLLAFDRHGGARP